MILTSFKSKIAFDDKIDCEYYYDNYIYNHIKVGQMLKFEVCNVTTKLGMMYLYIIEYSDLLFCNM